MGYEKGRYFTGTRRIGKRRQRTYFGKNEAGDLACSLQELRTLERHRQRVALRQDQTRWHEIETLLDQMDQESTNLVEIRLTALGFHRHRQGEWRKRRPGKPGASHQEQDMTIPQARRVQGAELAGRIEEELLLLASGGEPKKQALLVQELTSLRKSLGQQEDGALQRLLIERVVMCTFQVRYLDCLFGKRTDLTGLEGKELRRWLDRAQRRQIAALKGLALVRQLAKVKRGAKVERSQAHG